MRRLVLAVVMLVPSLASAQAGVVEITPTIGFRRGGGILVEDRAFQNRNVAVGLTSSGSFGIRFGVGLSRRLQLELLADRQNGHLKDDKGLFGEEPGGFVPVGSTSILDFKVTSYHLGLLWTLNDGPSPTYLVLSAGESRFEPGCPLPAASRFSAAAGVGIKVELDARTALRFEGRYYWADTSKLPSAVQQLGHKDCYQGGPCTYTYRYDSTLNQLQVSVGFVVRL